MAWSRSPCADAGLQPALGLPETGLDAASETFAGLLPALLAVPAPLP